MRKNDRLSSHKGAFKPVTVCVAAIADEGFIVGASDRRITSGDVQYDPDEPKIYPLTNSIVVMMAGEMTLHSEVYEQVYRDVVERIEFDPDNWWSVKDVAKLYCDYYCKLQEEEAERKFLRPRGLTVETFTARQREMLPEEVQRLGEKVNNYDPGEFEAIVAGIDATGPHIWRVKSEETHCQNRIGFAAIGDGAARVELEFMLAGHARHKPFSDTLHLTYIAKRRSEIAAGVGPDTDMFFIGSQVGTFKWVGDHVLEVLDKTYKKIRQKEARIIADSRKWMDENVTRFAEKARAQVQNSLPESGGEIGEADQRGLPAGSQDGEPEDG